MRASCSTLPVPWPGSRHRPNDYPSHRFGSLSAQDERAWRPTWETGVSIASGRIRCETATPVKHLADHEERDASLASRARTILACWHRRVILQCRPPDPFSMTHGWPPRPATVSQTDRLSHLHPAIDRPCRIEQRLCMSSGSRSGYSSTISARGQAIGDEVENQRYRDAHATDYGLAGENCRVGGNTAEARHRATCPHYHGAGIMPGISIPALVPVSSILQTGPVIRD